MTTDQHNRNQQSETDREETTQTDRNQNEGLPPRMKAALEECFRIYDETFRNLKDR